MIHLRERVVVAGGLALVLASANAGCGRSAGGSGPGAEMATARWAHTATLLPGGEVLVAGGFGSPCAVGMMGGPRCEAVAPAESYDPTTGSFAAAGTLTRARGGHTATLLPGGQVLLVAGLERTGGAGPQTVSCAELYDPVARAFTGTGCLGTVRSGHTATLLADGKVLVEGGVFLNTQPGAAELYEPVTGSFAPTGNPLSYRSNHTATLLPDGKVLLVGGSAELYDPAAGTFSATGSPAVVRSYHTATLLPSGKVLIAGGFGPAGTFNEDLASAELYDPVAGMFSPAGSLETARSHHTATLLPGGRVLIVGGSGSGGALSSAELYDPAAGTFTTTGAMAAARGYHTATLLPSGEVLIVGGSGSGRALSSTELYDPATGSFKDGAAAAR